MFTNFCDGDNLSLQEGVCLHCSHVIMIKRSPTPTFPIIFFMDFTVTSMVAT